MGPLGRTLAAEELLAEMPGNEVSPLAAELRLLKPSERTRQEETKLGEEWEGLGRTEILCSSIQGTFSSEPKAPLEAEALPRVREDSLPGLQGPPLRFPGSWATAWF